MYQFWSAKLQVNPLKTSFQDLEVNLLNIFHQATAINACNDLNYMYFTGMTSHNIMQYVHQCFPCKHAPNIYRANLSSTAPSSHLGEQMLDEQWVLDYHARCLRRAPVAENIGSEIIGSIHVTNYFCRNNWFQLL